MKKKRSNAAASSSAMIINVVNSASPLASNTDVQQVINALQVQLNRDFTPAWGIAAKLQLVTTVDNTAPTLHILKSSTSGDSSTLGYHDLPNTEIPTGFVYVQDSLNAGVTWSSTASHEMMEMILDPLANCWVDLKFKGKTAYFAYECCDPVQNDAYAINGVQLSNFVLPSWFLTSDTATQWDFMKKLTGPAQVDVGGDAIIFFQPGKLLSLQLGTTRMGRRKHADTTLTPVKKTDDTLIHGSRHWRRWKRAKS
jgi:hypothetical protein